MNNKWVEKIKNGTNSLKELLVIYAVSSIIVGTLFMLFEGQTFVDSMWWTYVTGLTIGYGDIYPQTIAGQVLTVIWAHYMVLFILPLFVGRIVISVIDNKHEFTDEEQKEVLKLLREIKNNK